MKKLLLLSAAVLSAMSSFAVVTDGITYQDVDGLTCTNKWFLGRNYNMDGWNALPFAGMAVKARTACLANVNGEDKILVGFSKTMTVDETSDDYAHLVVVNFFTGAVEKTVQLTCNGNPIKGLLCANQVGCDAFNNIWVAGLLSSTYLEPGEGQTEGKRMPLVVYRVTDLDNGICEVAASLSLTEDETDNARIDYCDVNGDITRTQGPCSVGAAGASSNLVFGWQCEQNSDVWTPKMNDGEYTAARIEEMYPAASVDWGTAPTLMFVNEEGYAASMMYIDGNTTCPSLYNTSGGIIDSFANASDLAPNPGPNGVAEFTFNDDQQFIVYVLNQYDKDPKCAIRVAQLGAGMAFEGMKSLYELPEGGVSDGISDTGTRVHSIFVRVYEDQAGKKGAYILSYKCNNLLAVYTVAQEGFVDDAGVNDVIADTDSNEPVQYFNLQGVAVDADNMAPGIYVARQGNKATKQIVR